MDKHSEKLSNFLSLILRHKPQVIGLQLDANGWAHVTELINLVNEHGIPISQESLQEIVAVSEDQRFVFDATQSRIRAVQESASPPPSALVSEQPPPLLYYGTASRLLASIRLKGLMPSNDQHVQLTSEELAAIKVGQRYGRPVVLTIHAHKMFHAGYQFFCSDDREWLTEFVPPRYIQFPTEGVTRPSSQ